MSLPPFPIIDLHTDFVMSCYEKGQEYNTSNQTSLTQLKDNNIRIIFSGFSYDDEFGDTSRQLEILQDQITSGNFSPINSYSDVSRVLTQPQSPIGMLIHMEGLKYLGNDLSNLEKYYNQGVRSIGLTHNHKNQFATGCKDGNDSGLTQLGKDLVKSAEKLNVVIDASHLNRRSFSDLLKISTKPIIISHGNAQSICNSSRNFSDDQIKELASQGGVMGLFFSAAYVNNNPNSASIDNIVEHCIHIADIAGTDCISIGSDFGGITTGTPKGLESVSKLPILFEKLYKAGFTNSDLEKISYKNIQTVLKRLLSV